MRLSLIFSNSLQKNIVIIINTKKKQKQNNLNSYIFTKKFKFFFSKKYFNYKSEIKFLVEEDLNNANEVDSQTTCSSSSGKLNIIILIIIN